MRSSTIVPVSGSYSYLLREPFGISIPYDVEVAG
jgi:hypothetical protein